MAATYNTCAPRHSCIGQSVNHIKTELIALCLYSINLNWNKFHAAAHTLKAVIAGPGNVKLSWVAPARTVLTKG